MSAQPDHEIETLEDDQTVPPRPEEVIADASRLAPEGQDAPDAGGPVPAG